jgi:hypothetical protein
MRRARNENFVAPPTRRRLLALALALGGAACLPACQSVAALVTPKRAAIETEPPATAAFLDAFARGDEAGAERVASPLYRAEWERRRISVDDRLAWRPANAGSSAWARFTYVGGVVESPSAHHLLFTAESLTESVPAYTVWRLDTDADGRIIWCEEVYLFSDGAAPLNAVTRRRGDDFAALLPPQLVADDPLLLVGVRAAGSREGYYLIVLPPVDDARLPSTARSRQTRYVFLAVDPEGVIRPGTWTYREGLS